MDSSWGGFRPDSPLSLGTAASFVQKNKASTPDGDLSSPSHSTIPGAVEFCLQQKHHFLFFYSHTFF